MDSDSFQADLNALRKLYTLLQINGSGKHNALSGILDEDTRNFLKKLLDDAAKKIYEVHMKTKANDWRSVLGTNSLGQLEEPKEQEKLQYAISKIESLVPKLHRIAKHVPTPTKNNDRRRVAQLNESDSSRSDSSSWKTRKVSSSSSSSGTTQTSTTGSGGENDSQSSCSTTTYVTSKSSRSSLSSYVGSEDDDLNPSDSYESRTESVAHRKEGMFRRLKNKLGVIFHHHHHHHHHHPHSHDKSDDASVSQSVWKKEAGKKKLRRTEKRVEAKVGKKFRKTEKKAESENQKRVRKGKKHPGHFRVLLGGLMRHAIESRKRQRKLGRGPHGKKPNLRLKDVKLAHKPRMKLQLGKKKGRLG